MDYSPILHFMLLKRLCDPKKNSHGVDITLINNVFPDIQGWLSLVSSKNNFLLFDWLEIYVISR
jgi:hypothetical protein